MIYNKISLINYRNILRKNSIITFLCCSTKSLHQHSLTFTAIKDIMVLDSFFFGKGVNKAALVKNTILYPAIAKGRKDFYEIYS